MRSGGLIFAILSPISAKSGRFLKGVVILRNPYPPYRQAMPNFCEFYQNFANIRKNLDFQKYTFVFIFRDTRVAEIPFLGFIRHAPIGMGSGLGA